MFGIGTLPAIATIRVLGLELEGFVEIGAGFVMTPECVVERRPGRIGRRSPVGLLDGLVGQFKEPFAQTLIGAFRHLGRRNPPEVAAVLGLVRPPSRCWPTPWS